MKVLYVSTDADDGISTHGSSPFTAGVSDETGGTSFGGNPRKDWGLGGGDGVCAGGGSTPLASEPNGVVSVVTGRIALPALPAGPLKLKE